MMDYQSYLEPFHLQLGLPKNIGVRDSDTLTLPTICSLDFLKRVNCSLAVNHSSSNPGSYSWSNMTWIIEFLDMTSLIQNYRSAAVLLTTVQKMSSNKACCCGKIEPVHKFRTKPICVECIIMNPILTPL